MPTYKSTGFRFVLNPEIANAILKGKCPEELQKSLQCRIKETKKLPELTITWKNDEEEGKAVTLDPVDFWNTLFGEIQSLYEEK